MTDSLDQVLHPRVVKGALARYRAGFFKDAVREAMAQVELALKEKVGGSHMYGVSLIRSVFGNKPGIKLWVPFGQHMQGYAEKYFEATFQYYRNYAAHEGDGIDGPMSLRVLAIASDLLFLIGASTVSFTEVGGADGLVKLGVFSSRDNLLDLLGLLDGYCLPDEVADGFYEELAKRGFKDRQLQSLFDCGLCDYQVNENLDNDIDTTDTIGVFSLTPLGHTVLKG